MTEMVRSDWVRANPGSRADFWAHVEGRYQNKAVLSGHRADFMQQMTSLHLDVEHKVGGWIWGALICFILDFDMFFI